MKWQNSTAGINFETRNRRWYHPEISSTKCGITDGRDPIFSFSSVRVTSLLLCSEGCALCSCRLGLDGPKQLGLPCISSRKICAAGSPRAPCTIAAPLFLVSLYWSRPVGLVSRGVAFLWRFLMVVLELVGEGLAFGAAGFVFISHASFSRGSYKI